ncbi:MAG: hypothetical protein IPG04_24095 [Polyangiaceae bacterium]|nr:hypothetical protein [Polyangiaceae bacterium]
MRIVIEGRRATLDTKSVLGEGGEATVLLLVDRGARLAVKVYKSPPGRRLEKVRALSCLRASLSDIAVLPDAIVEDAKSGAPIGYVMAALEPGHEPIASLSRESFCAAAGLGLSAVLRTLAALGAGLGRIHAAGAVVGDLNDQNELRSAADGRVTFIDCDSFQVADLPCEVATEAFLDPLLYGPDVACPCATRDGQPRWFGRGSDWYAFSVIAFRSLTGVHPFGGVDAALPSLARRALARRSVLSAGVVVPSKVRSRIDALSPTARAAFVGVFEHGDRRPFPIEVLAEGASSVWRCGCGLEVAGPSRPCPRCATAVPIRAGALEVTELAQAQGRFFAAASDAVRWVAAAREGERVRLVTASHHEREASWVDLGHAARSLAPAWLTASLVVTARTALELAELEVFDALTGRLVLTTTTEVAFGAPSVSVSGPRVYRLAKGTVLQLDRDEHGRWSEREVGQVVSGQTALYAAEVGVLAATQVLGRRAYAWLTPGGVVELECAPLGPGESIADEWLAADREHAVVLRLVRSAGRELVATSAFDRRGRALVSATSAACARPAGAAIRGALVARGAALVASDAGLVRHPLVANGPPTLFAETEPHVVREAPIAACPRGVLVAAGAALKLLSIATRTH